MLRTKRLVVQRIYLKEYTVPAGTRLATVRDGRGGDLYVVANPLLDIPEVRDDNWLKWDLDHHYIYIDPSNVEEVP